MVGIVAAATAAILFIAPSASHRRLWPDNEADAAALVRSANRQAIAAQGFKGLAMCASLFVVVDLIFGEPLAVVIPVAVAALIVVFWFRRPEGSRRR